MSKKKMSEFKQRIEVNKKVVEKKRERVETNKLVSVNLEENLIAKVDRGNYYVSSEEIKELVKDLFYTKVELKENSIIDLDEVCDVCYRLSYRGIIGNEAIFKLC